jgi:hypothetical protein
VWQEGQLVCGITLWSEASSSPRGLERGVSGSEHGHVATMPSCLFLVGDSGSSKFTIIYVYFFT